jgi:hypothetical protein
MQKHECQVGEKKEQLILSGVGKVVIWTQQQFESIQFLSKQCIHSDLFLN